MMKLFSIELLTLVSLLQLLKANTSSVCIELLGALIGSLTQTQLLICYVLELLMLKQKL